MSGSSRSNTFNAGWDEQGDARSGDAARFGTWRDRLCTERIAPKWDRFSWLTVRALFESVNDQLAKLQPQLVSKRRLRWIAHQRAARVNEGAPSAAIAGSRLRPGFVIDHSDQDDPAFFLVGDTGEQDASQYAVAPLLTGTPHRQGPDDQLRETAFTVIVSDVIYPAGDINEYVNGFYVPYRHYRRPIYAIPGNHDWYDGLNGFMYHFCGADPLPQETFRLTNVRPGARMAEWLWRGSEPPERPLLSRWRDSRRPARQKGAPLQPAPYFAIDTKDLLIVAIDTGITGEIDDEQGRWLLKVSQLPKQKILLTGKPLYVDNAYHPGEIAWTGGAPLAEDRPEAPRIKTVDDVVRYRRFGYLAAIGGDVHNYQRYSVWHKHQRRLIHYLVSGGGGAYLSPTHRIPRVGGRPKSKETLPWPEAEVSMPEESGDDSAPYAFRCYPLRGDSLAYGARRTGPRLFKALVFAAAAFCAAAWLYGKGLPRPGGLSAPGATKESARLGPIAVYGVLAALSLVGLLAMQYVRRFLDAVDQLRAAAEAEQEAELEPVPPAEQPQQGTLIQELAKRGFQWAPQLKRLLLLAPLIVIACSTFVVDLFATHSVVSDGQFWIAVGLSLAVPVLVVAGILVSHDLRGSVGTWVPDLLIVGSGIAAVFVAFGVPGLFEEPEWFAGTAWGLLIAAAGFLAVGVLRSLGSPPDPPSGLGTPEEPPPLPSGTTPASSGGEAMSAGRQIAFVLFRLVAVLAPVSLALALALEFDSGWVPRVAGGLALPLALAAVLGKPEPADPCGRLPTALRWLDVSVQAAAGLAAILAILILLAEVGDGWITTGIVAATSFLILALVLLLLCALFTLTVLRLTLISLVLAVVVFISAVASPTYALGPTLVLGIASGAFLLLTIGGLSPLRGGQINARRAGAFMADRLDLTPMPRDGTELPSGDEETLARLLYPFKRGESERSTGALVRAAAGLFSELSDADEPPFFKSFLRADVVSSQSSGQGTDRRLIFRCFGITGFAEEEADPPLEDEIAIDFCSAQTWPSERDSAPVAD